MTEIELLTRQTQGAYNWANKFVETIPFDKWKIIPDTIESSVNWQVGHLIVSVYYHSIMVIKGHRREILQKVPLKDYSELFSEASPKLSVGKVNSNDLLDHLKIVQEGSLLTISTLPVTELGNNLEPTSTPHPIAKTKQESIEWNIKHTMYHCGQIGILRRVIFERFDFGLRIAK